MTEIRNTTADMRTANSADRMLAIAIGMADGNLNTFIENQEHAGQQQFVHSEMLPTDTRGGTDADFEKVGFTFGEPLANDPMFRSATLPEGWTKQGSDHDMWSYVVDQLGRRRVAVFYKAAFYDRSAFMRLIDVAEYVYSHIGGYDGYGQLVTDDAWATPEVIAEAALKQAADHQKQIDEYNAWLLESRDSRGYGRPEHAEKYLPAEIEKHAKCVALADRFAGSAK